MAIRSGVLATLVAAGITTETPDQDLKKAYFKAAGAPLSTALLGQLRGALAGDTTNVVTDEQAAAAKAAKPAKVKTEKPAKEPRPVRSAETPDQALARLQADPATAARWARVVRVEEMGKKGPTKVTIRCDDTNEDGSARFRTIKVQDLFQVKFSEGHQKSRKSAAKAATAPAATESAA